jgi:beta-glucosidase
VVVLFLDPDGAVLATRHRSGGSLTWLGSFGPDLPGDRIATVEVRARLRAGPKGRYTIGVSGLGRYRMYVDGGELFEATIVLPPGADIVDGIMLPPQHGPRRLHVVIVAADLRDHGRLFLHR